MRFRSLFFTGLILFGPLTVANAQQIDGLYTCAISGDVREIDNSLRGRIMRTPFMQGFLRALGFSEEEALQIGHRHRVFSNSRGFSSDNAELVCVDNVTGIEALRKPIFVTIIRNGRSIQIGEQTSIQLAQFQFGAQNLETLRTIRIFGRGLVFTGPAGTAEYGMGFQIATGEGQLSGVSGALILSGGDNANTRSQFERATFGIQVVRNWTISIADRELIDTEMPLVP